MAGAWESDNAGADRPRKRGAAFRLRGVISGTVTDFFEYEQKEGAVHRRGAGADAK